MTTETPVLTEGKLVRGTCPHDCPDTCALETIVKDGVAKSIRGAKAHPPTAGALCLKVSKYLDRTYHPDRLKTPLLRTGPRGSGHFEPISWEDALARIAQNIKSAVAEHGGESVLPYHFAGNMGLLQNASIDRRIFHALGACQLNESLCSSCGAEALDHTIGGRMGMHAEFFSEAELIVIWGSNPIHSSVHLWARIQTAQKAGAKVVVIDPYQSTTAKKCDHWIALRPGTDAAFALAVANVLIEEGLTDANFIEDHTLGYDAYRARAAEWPVDKAAQVCGIDPKEISDFARLYASTKKAAIRLNWGMQRHAGGGAAMRAVVCLPALTGAWRERSGGVLVSTTSMYPVDYNYLARPDLMKGAAEPRTVNMVLLADELERREADALGPPIKVLFVYNTNPVASLPDKARLVSALDREDLFVVVHELFMTDTAKHADIILPATSQLEHFDIHRSYGHTHVMINHPAIPPIGEAKSNTDMFRALARALELTDPVFQESDEAMARNAFDWQHTVMSGASYDEIAEAGWFKMKWPDAPFANGDFLTPSGKCEFFSSRLQDLGLDPLPAFIPPHEFRADQSDDPHPLMLLSPPVRHFMNSTFANVPSVSAAVPDPVVEIAPSDAAARNIASGDEVEIFNNRGAVKLPAKINRGVKPGTIVALYGHWPDQMNRGHLNDLTSSKLTDMGGGATLFDCAVDIRRVG